MRARGWFGGNVDSPVYGLAITPGDRDALIDRSWRQVVLFLGDSDEPTAVDLSDAFWHRCPELRDPAIRTWFAELGVIPWPKGSPPSFGMRNLGGNRFSVKHIERRSLL